MWIEMEDIKCPICGHYVRHEEMYYDEEIDEAICGLCIENREIGMAV